MKKTNLIILVLLICSTLFYSCDSITNSGGGKFPEDAKVVAERPNVDDPDFISLDFTKLDNEIAIPLSYFVEELQMVKLEGGDEALVSGGATIVTDNYILVRNQKHNPYKLFDKQGKFLTAIGAYGRGPNEYLNVYDDYFDEETQQIFILPLQSEVILRYNLKGEPLKPIPLPYRAPKGKFTVDVENKTVSVFALPFEKVVPLIAWKQNFEGKIIDSIPSGHLSMRPDFSNEAFSNKNTDNFDCSIGFYPSRIDTLYHYNDAGKLCPKFTLDYGDKPAGIHAYTELPNHYMGWTAIPKQLTETDTGSQNHMRFIVDKKTLKGSYYKLHNDFLGDAPTEWVAFANGNYVWNVEPMELKDVISTQLKENIDMDEQMRQKLTDLHDSIDENGNNYVFHAKLKR